MITESISTLRDLLHAQLCYQLFITPIHVPLEKKYRDFSKIACEFIEIKRSGIIHNDFPRHHVLHHFIPTKNARNKKILITHGWVSRAAYMVCLIKKLHQQGYEVYALDFPAHGEAKGLQLPWPDAVHILKNVINEHGPFYGVIGHSFGGSMLLNTLNLSGQLDEWQLKPKPQRVVLIASPTHMRNTVSTVARRFKLSKYGYLQLCQLFRQQTRIHPDFVRLRRFITQTPDTPFLCIHGEQDDTVSPKESIDFCKKYKNANLVLLKDADHISVLMDKRVEQSVCEFLDN